jgi:hypothetical protein
MFPAHCRVVEDYGVIYLGSAVFKIARLLFIAMFSVHMFACLFYRVKIISSAAEDVALFYTSKNVPENVSLVSLHVPSLLFFALAELNSLGCEHYDDCFDGRILDNNMWVVPLTVQISPVLILTTEIHAAFHVFLIFAYPTFVQLVCFYYVLTTFTTVGYGDSQQI